MAFVTTPGQSFGVPGLTLTTANAEGSALNAVRTDAELLVFDTTVVSSIAYGASANAGSQAVASRRDHTHGMPAGPLVTVYEEGSWTPVLKDSGGSNSATLSLAVGRYTRIGRVVQIQGRLTVSGEGSITNHALTIYIHGLPFTAQNTASDLQSSFTFGLTGGLAVTSGVSVAGVVEQNGEKIVLLVNDATTGMSNMLFSELSTDGALSLTGSYIV